MVYSYLIFCSKRASCVAIFIHLMYLTFNEVVLEDWRRRYFEFLRIYSEKYKHWCMIRVPFFSDKRLSSSTIVALICGALFVLIICVLSMYFYKRHILKKHALYMAPDPKFSVSLFLLKCVLFNTFFPIVPFWSPLKTWENPLFSGLIKRKYCEGKVESERILVVRFSLGFLKLTTRNYRLKWVTIYSRIQEWAK